MTENDLTPWERPAAAGGFTLEESARRIGHYAWAEMRIFEMLGAWSRTIPEPSVATVVATHANQHAWHAELWHQRFPELREWDRADAVRPGSGELVTFFEMATDATSTIDRLVVTYRVLLPHLVAAYGFHRNRASEVSDGPVLRSLGFVLGDDLAQLADGALMAAATITDVVVAAEVQQRSETALIAAGGIAGPGTIPPM